MCFDVQCVRSQERARDRAAAGAAQVRPQDGAQVAPPVVYQEPREALQSDRTYTALNAYDVLMPCLSHCPHPQCVRPGALPVAHVC